MREEEAAVVKEEGESAALHCNLTQWACRDDGNSTVTDALVAQVRRAGGIMAHTEIRT